MHIVVFQHLGHITKFSEYAVRKNLQKGHDGALLVYSHSNINVYCVYCVLHCKVVLKAVLQEELFALVIDWSGLSSFPYGSG